MIWHPVKHRGLISTQQRCAWYSEKQVTLAVPATTPGPWIDPLWVPAVHLWLGNHLEHAGTGPSSRSQLLCIWLKEGFGGHPCQFQLDCGHVLAARLWKM